jgi:hypothetical protein
MRSSPLSPKVFSIRLDNRTKRDIANEATWADKIKSDSTLRQRTSQWHFVDIEIDFPNLDTAWFDHPKIPTGAVAFDGPAKDCLVDKIDEFAAELKKPPRRTRRSR